MEDRLIAAEFSFWTNPPVVINNAESISPWDDNETGYLTRWINTASGTYAVRAFFNGRKLERIIVI